MVETSPFTTFLTPTSLFLLLNLVILTIFLTTLFSHHNNHREPPPPGFTHLSRPPSLLSRVTSFNFNHYQQPDPVGDPSGPLSQPPSLLSRVTSFNFSGFSRASQPEPDPPMTHQHKVVDDYKNSPSEESVVVDTPPSSMFSRVTSVKFSGLNRAVQPESDPPVTVTQKVESPSLLNRVASFGLSKPQQPNPAREGVRAGGLSEGKSGNNGESRAGKEKKTKKQQVARGTRVMKANETFSFEGEEEVDAKADDFINRFKQQLKMQRLDSLLRYRNSAA